MSITLKAANDGLSGEIQLTGTRVVDVLAKGLGMAQLLVVFI